MINNILQMKRNLLVSALFLCASCTVGTTILNEGDYKVTGSVTCEGQPLQGVIVTDGYNFAQSNRKGNFELIVTDSSKFVSVATPSGYTTAFADGVPDFYLPASEQSESYDFQLAKWGEADKYQLVSIGDIQYMTQAHFDRFETGVFPDIKSYVEGEQAKGIQPVLITLGDITWDNFELYSQYVDLVKSLPAPLYPVIGNHDHDKDSVGDSESAHHYNKFFGPEYYAFNLGEDYYIVLDNIIYDTQKSYVESVSKGQQEWIKSYLEFIPKGSNVYVCMHSPVICYGRVVDKSYEEWVPLFDGYNLSVISGHTHLLFNKESLPGLFEHNVGAACGVWWTADTGKDGAPIGYQIFESREGDKASWRYKSVGYDLDYQAKLYKDVEGHKESIVAYIWAVDDVWTVKGSFDGGAPVKGERITMTNPDYDLYVEQLGGVASYKSSIATDCYFTFEIPQGATNFSLTATDSFGNIYSESIEL